MARINGEDITKFRAKNYVKPINELGDLNQKSKDVIDIVDRVSALEKKGFELLNSLPDNSTTCSVEAKYFITSTIERAKWIIGHCIEKHLNKENPDGRLELNVRSSEWNWSFVKSSLLFELFLR